MPIDMDAALRSLAIANHPGFDGLENAVLGEVRSRREMRGSLRMAAVAGFGGVLFGAYAAGPAATPASAAPLAPFGAAAPLAPSTLLASDR